MRNWIRWRLQNPEGLFFSLLFFGFAAIVLYFADTPDLGCAECQRLSPLILSACSALAGLVILVMQP